MNTKIEITVKVRGRIVVAKLRSNQKIQRVVRFLKQKGLIQASTQDNSLEVINLSNMSQLPFSEEIGNINVCRQSGKRQVQIKIGKQDNMKNDEYPIMSNVSYDIATEQILLSLCQMILSDDTFQIQKLIKQKKVSYKILQMLNKLKNFYNKDESEKKMVDNNKLSSLVNERIRQIEFNYKQQIQVRQMSYKQVMDGLNSQIKALNQKIGKLENNNQIKILHQYIIKLGDNNQQIQKTLKQQKYLSPQSQSALLYTSNRLKIKTKQLQHQITQLKVQIEKSKENSNKKTSVALNKQQNSKNEARWSEKSEESKKISSQVSQKQIGSNKQIKNQGDKVIIVPTSPKSLSNKGQKILLAQSLMLRKQSFENKIAEYSDFLQLSIQRYMNTKINSIKSNYYAESNQVTQLANTVKNKPNFILIFANKNKIFGIFSQKAIGSSAKSQEGLFFGLTIQRVFEPKKNTPIWKQSSVDIKIGKDAIKIDKKLCASLNKINQSFNLQGIQLNEIFGTSQNKFNIESIELLLLEFQKSQEKSEFKQPEMTKEVSQKSQS